MIELLRRWRAGASGNATGSEAELRPSRDVFCTRMDDRCVLLDLRRGQYVGLDEVGSSMWDGLERGVARSELIHEIARQYDAPVDRIAEDVRLFTADLRRRGLVRDVALQDARAPRLLTCLALLVLMDVLPRLFGLGRALALVRRIGVRRDVRRDPALVAETTRQLVLAAAFYPRRALCLEQSLALCLLLRRRGVAAELKIGVQPLPFHAHAWVEVAGKPVEERQQLPLHLATFNGLGV